MGQRQADPAGALAFLAAVAKDESTPLGDHRNAARLLDEALTQRYNAADRERKAAARALKLLRDMFPQGGEPEAPKHDQES